MAEAPVVIELVGGPEDGFRFALPVGVEPPLGLELARDGSKTMFEQYRREKQEGPVVFYRWLKTRVETEGQR